MTNIISVIIDSIFQTNPYIAYLFFSMIIIGVGITYLYRKEAGFLITVIVSSILGYSGIFSPLIYIISTVCLALLILSLIGGGSIKRPITNLQSWFYLKWMTRKNK